MWDYETCSVIRVEMSAVLYNKELWMIEHMTSSRRRDEHWSAFDGGSGGRGGTLSQESGAMSSEMFSWGSEGVTEKKKGKNNRLSVLPVFCVSVGAQRERRRKKRAL